jgi:hypothetical protein
MRTDAEVFSFLPPEAFKLSIYGACATPSLYAGNSIRARVHALAVNQTAVQARLFVRAYQAGAGVSLREGPLVDLVPGQDGILEWEAPETGGWPIFSVGIQLIGPMDSAIDLDWLTWEGTPSLTFAPPEDSANSENLSVWRQSFIHNLDSVSWDRGLPPHQTVSLIKNRGRGLLHTGTRAWADYRVSCHIKPWTVTECGIAARVQGLTRQYALVLRPGNRLLLVRMVHVETVLAEVEFPWELRKTYELELEVRGDQITGSVDGVPLLKAQDSVLSEGGIGVIVGNGRINASPLRIQ